MALIVPACAQPAATNLLDELTKKAQAGDAETQLQLGEAYEYGKNLPQDDELAVQWYRKAAEQANARAANALGVMYLDRARRDAKIKYP